MMLHRSPSSNGPRQIAQSSATSVSAADGSGSPPPAARIRDAVQQGDDDGFGVRVYLLRQPGVRLLLVLIMIVLAAQQADDDKHCCDDEESKQAGVHHRWTNHDDRRHI